MSVFEDIKTGLNQAIEYEKGNLKDIVIEPGKTVTANLSFKKFVDDNDASNFLVFSSIRVMEKYSGTENLEESVIQSEIDNAIAKFSMKVSTAE